MTPERWQQIQEVFGQALDQPAAQRDTFVDRACGGDPELLQEVQSLVQAHARTATLVESPALGPGFQMPQPDALIDAPDTTVPQRLGPYRVIRLIAGGGMGAVYLGVRDDGHFQQQVALKLIRYPQDGESLLRRFYRERQMLAELNHPHIAKLLDGGATPEGLPYLVMEFIDGLPIDQYCRRRELSIVDRLRMFLKVCEAVQYAHQNLVVHCDLKPGNILVTAEGVPKLLDFGIARMLSAPPSTEHPPTTVPLTLLTPDYASPEHVRGSHVSIGSDVYSLGVVLYELLVGRRPFRLNTRIRSEIERIVCETEPLKPSTAVRNGAGDGNGHGHRLSRRLAGDLDNIVLKALRKEPQRRYASVEQLSEDVRRHLTGLPVSARQDTFGYLASKFVRRHKVAVITAAVVLGSLLGGLFAVQRQAGIAKEQRDLAQANLQRALLAERQSAAQAEAAERSAQHARTTARQAQILNAFLQSMLSAADPYRAGKDVTVMEILDRADEWVGTGLSGEPAVEAVLRQTIGNTYRNLGAFDKAERHLQAAVAIFEDQAAAGRPARERLARGLVDLAALLQDRGDYAGAEVLYRRSLQSYRDLWGDDHLDVVSTLAYLAVLCDEKGDRRAAVALYNEASSIYARLLGDTGEAEATAGQPAEDYSHLASLLRYQGDWKRAERLLRQTLAGQLELFGRQHPKVADSLYNLAVFLHDKGDLQAAEPLHQQALSMRRALLGDNHPRVAESLEALATLHYDRNDYESAEELLWQVYDIRREILPAEHPDYAATLTLLADVLLERNAPAGAEPLLRQCLAVQRRTLPPDDWQIARTRSLLGACLTELGEYQEAEQLLLDSFPRLEAECGLTDEQTMATLSRIIHLYQASGHPEQAASWRTRMGSPTEPPEG